MKLSALVVCRNEEDVLKGCLDRIHPYVDEIVFLDMQSTDKSAEIAKSYDKVKYFEYPYSNRIDLARTFSFQQAQGEWCLIVDCDEYYLPESMKKIREFVENPGDNISARVKYYNVAWRHGYVEPINHFPDRLYKREVFSHYEGVLPLDMLIVKEEFRLCKHKGKGTEGVLEYDNPDDRSFEHPRQPILHDAIFYHLARARGFNYEYNKRLGYERNIHPSHQEWEHEQNTRMNQWVASNYTIVKENIPIDIPTKVIPKPKVSVIVTCYNKGKWIGETIESILVNNPFEVIVVDDGSTDNSVEIISRYPVTLIKQQNQGVAVARNNGLNKLTGDYFILIDGDDKLAPNYIERCLQEMKGDIQVVWTDFKGLDEWEGMHHKYSGNIEDLKTAQCIPSVMALYDSRVRDVYGNFKLEAHFEDTEWFLNLYFNRKMNFKHIAEPLCFYRRNTGTRIDELDKKKKEGFDQLNQWYGKFGVNYKV